MRRTVWRRHLPSFFQPRYRSAEWRSGPTGPTPPKRYSNSRTAAAPHSPFDESGYKARFTRYLSTSETPIMFPVTGIRRVSSERKRVLATAAHPSRVRVLVTHCPLDRTWHHRSSPRAASGRCRGRQMAAARNTGSGSAHSSPLPAAGCHPSLARQTLGNNPRSSYRPTQEHIQANCHWPARTAARRSTASSRS
jgi:hypothetical protein